MDDDLRYIAELILTKGLDAVPYIDAHHPSITRRVRVSSAMQTVLRNASAYLHANPPTTQGLGVAAYLSFAGLVFIEIGRYGFDGALPYIQADRDQFLLWGFNLAVLRALALLQGVVL